MRHVRRILIKSSVHLDYGSCLMTLAHRVGPLLGPIAPPGSARRRVLRFAFHAARALPKLLKPQYVAHEVATLWDSLRLQLALLSCRDPLAKEQMRSSARYRWRSIIGSFAFPVVDHPRVSVIIPVCNQFWKTLECLQAISTSSGSPAYEVIVVDDLSTDRTSRILSGIPGLLTLKNNRKLGTIASCDRGAEKARGEYLVFLNQDARVMRGGLTALAQTFELMPKTGLAGAKLILPDGRLLEAGGALWRDGGGTSYGKFGDVDHPSYNFAREVDFCSGGCLMVTRALFLEIGGFDAGHEADAREEIDLAMRIRHTGHKVIYQPLASVVQSDRARPKARVSPAAGSQQRAAQQGFRERWRERLDHHPQPGPGVLRLVRAHGAESARFGQVLVIDHRLPTADRDSGSFRIMELIRAILRRGHHVTFIPDNMAVFSPYLEELQRVGVQVVHPPFYSSVEEYLKQHGHEFNLAILCRADVAGRHMDTVRRNAPQARIVFDTVDLCFVREERQARIGEDPNLGALVASRKEQELRLARTADRTLVVSPIEKAVLEAECGHEIQVRILSNILPIPENNPSGYEHRRDILFIGGFDHAPNIDAVLFFAQEIFPRIQRRIPEAVFQVIGPYPTPEISRLNSPSVQILGFVPEVKPIFDRAKVSVAPLRFGAGVKGKVNQSMSFGVPTVVTSIAAEGMYLTHAENAMIADDPQPFADAVIALYTSPGLWQKVSRNGLRNVIDHFSIEAAARPIDDLLAWAGLWTASGN
jgi:O-antigen biosynthesis protein